MNLIFACLCHLMYERKWAAASALVDSHPELLELFVGHSPDPDA